MDTQIAFEKDGKTYNKFHEEIIECIGCTNPTTMTGTQLCDRCWNAKGIFTAIETAELEHALDFQKDFVKNLKVGRHWTREMKNNRLKRIDSLLEKLKAIQ